MSFTVEFLTEDGQPVPKQDPIPSADLPKYMVVGDKMEYLDGRRFVVAQKVFSQISSGVYKVVFTFHPA
ncbi:MAG: hypothetical protein ACOH2P_02200 [Pseudomonas sp.]